MSRDHALCIVNDPAPSPAKDEGRILVLETDETLAESIVSAAHEAAPAATVDVARNLEDAHRVIREDRPDLFVLDLDSFPDLGQDFLLDLRTSHPNARAIILTGVHLPSQREQAAGIGAIHFLEKPFPHSDFVDLVQSSLHISQDDDSEKFQGTLSDLHLSDIIQLKCMSGATSALEFTGPQGEKARVYFENGQVRHAVAPGLEGVEAFNEIISWRGGKISEVGGAANPPRTIELDWQFLLMEAVRKMDETGARRERRKQSAPAQRHKVLVVDDSLMLLSFVEEILQEANYDVVTASRGEDGLRAVREQKPDLVLLDYILPDMHGDEVTRELAADSETAAIPVLYMSGFGADLEKNPVASSNVLGFVNKPFTSGFLLKSVEKYLPRLPDDDSAGGVEPREEPALRAEFASVIGPEESPESPGTPLWGETPTAFTHSGIVSSSAPVVPAAPAASAYFSGDTSFFSLNWALRIMEKEKLTGVLRCFWEKETVELFARVGQVLLVTTRDPEQYCSEAPITLVNVDPERVAAARALQAQNGCPLFLTLAHEDLILREPALQLVEHYGQKLFAQLWGAPRVRLAFEQLSALPDFTSEVTAEEETDHWTLATLRVLQFQDVAEKVGYDPAWIPAYTRDGFERVQKLRLTVAEAQFASQFNGVRSIAQIARNLRLDLKFARLTLFRFLAMEIVECWPPGAPDKSEDGSFMKRFGRSIGLGE